MLTDDAVEDGACLAKQRPLTTTLSLSSGLGAQALKKNKETDFAIYNIRCTVWRLTPIQNPRNKYHKIIPPLYFLALL